MGARIKRLTTTGSALVRPIHSPTQAVREGFERALTAAAVGELALHFG